MTDKAIEAAYNAAWEQWNIHRSLRDQVNAAIAAYTAALLPEDVAGLVERLQRHEGIGAALARTDANGRYAEAAMDEAASALTALSARRAEAERERDDFRSSLATTIGKLKVAQDRAAALERDLAEVRAALKPFAAIYVGVEDDSSARDSDQWFRYDGDVLRVGDFRRARALLAGKETADDGK